MVRKTPSDRPWLIRVLGKWIWLLGLLPQFLDFLAAYLPRDLLPQSLTRFVEAGATWQATLALLTIGLLGSAYLVHRETQLEQEKLAHDLSALRNTYPKLSAAFHTPEGTPTDSLTIALLPVPDPPDFDSQVANKRRELLSQRPRPNDSAIPETLGTLAALALASAFSDPNPDFEHEVDEYLPRYRKYLIEKYEVALPRAFYTHPILLNTGTTAATSVILEIEMPSSYSPPEPHQLAKLEGLDEEFLDVVPIKPTEPKPTNPRFDHTSSFFTLPPSLDLLVPPPPDPNDSDLEQRVGRWYITYHVARIVPKRTYSELNSFPIWAPAAAPSSPWELTARIYCAELPSPLQ